MEDMWLRNTLMGGVDDVQPEKQQDADNTQTSSAWWKFCQFLKSGRMLQKRSKGKTVSMKVLRRQPDDGVGSRCPQ